MKRWTQGLITAALLASMTVSGFAAGTGTNFSDVAADHWALSAINTVTSKEIMPDYTNGSFKPLQKVSKVEAVVIAYRLVKESGQLGNFSAKTSVEAHKAALSAAGIPALFEPYSSDVYTAFGFALDKNLISKEDLSAYMSAGKPKEITKEEFSALLGKTLNLVKKQDMSAKIISLSFVDNGDINMTLAPHISLMVDYKLISKTGDASGKFNPKTTLGRDVSASMVAGVYAAMTGGTVPVTPPTTGTVTTPPTTTTPVTPPTTPTTGTGTTPTTPVTTATTLQTGVITSVFTDKFSIEVKDKLDKINVFSLSGTEIMKNNERIGFLNVEVGNEVTLSLSGGKVTKMVVSVVYPTIEGKFDNLSKPQTDPTTKEVTRIVTLVNAQGAKEYKKVKIGTLVEVDHAIKTVEDLVVGDKVVVSYEGHYATKISAYSAKHELLITIAKPFELKAGTMFTYKLPDGRLMDVKLSTVPEVVKSGGKDLKKGDIVKATFLFGELKKMEATGMVAEDSGNIREILISDGTSKITILNKQNERKTYNVQTKVALTIGDAKTTIDGLYQLRIGQEASMEMDTAGIHTMNVTNVLTVKPVEKTKLTLTVMEVLKGNLFSATDLSGKTWAVSIKEGSGIIVETLKAGDKIEVTGNKLSEGFLEAEQLVKVN